MENLSRRKLIFGALSAGLTTAMLDAWWSRAFGESIKQRLQAEGVTALDTASQKSFEKDVVDLLDFFKEKYALDIETPTSVEVVYNKINGKEDQNDKRTVEPVTESALILVALKTLKKALEPFPPDSLSASLKTVRLTGTITSQKFQGTNMRMYGFTEAGGVGRVTFRIQDLLTNGQNHTSNKKENNGMRVHHVHHELAHILFDGIRDPGFFEDFQTEVYGGQLTSQDQYDRRIFEKIENGSVTEPFEGFISSYAKVSVLEDVAETLMHMMRSVDELWVRFQSDEVLKAKVDFLRDAFVQKFKLPQTYWEDLWDDKVNIDYWERNGRVVEINQMN